MIRLSMLRACLAGVALAMFIPAPVFAASFDGPNPIEDEEAALAQYPVYSGYIHLYEPNTATGIHAFLDSHIGQNVFIDAAILRYMPLSRFVTEEDKPRLPTDRFQNPVWTACHVDQGVLQSYTDFGGRGFPFPRSERDIAQGCPERLKLSLLWGDVQPNVDIRPGRNKVEIGLRGFFTVSKDTPASGQSLYVLTEIAETEEMYFLYVANKADNERPLREVTLNTPPPPGQ